MEKGKLICIVGSDSSGKETQTKLLLENFQKDGINCKSMDFPQYNTPTGKIVGQCYLGKDFGFGQGSWFGDSDKVNPKIAALYYAGDRLFSKPKMENILNSGTNLILDRYYQDNMAHQGGKLKTKKERLEMINWLQTLELELLKIPKEDMTTFLYMPTEIAIELREKREKITGEKPDGHENNIGHLKRANKTFLELTDYLNWTKIDCATGTTIDTLKTPKQISREVYTQVKNKLKI